eukprot:524619-Rhodomonas_salina.2
MLPIFPPGLSSTICSRIPPVERTRWHVQRDTATPTSRDARDSLPECLSSRFLLHSRTVDRPGAAIEPLNLRTRQLGTAHPSSSSEFAYQMHVKIGIPPTDA